MYTALPTLTNSTHAHDNQHTPDLAIPIPTYIAKQALEQLARR